MAGVKKLIETADLLLMNVQFVLNHQEKKLLKQDVLKAPKGKYKSFLEQLEIRAKQAAGVLTLTEDEWQLITEYAFKLNDCARGENEPASNAARFLQAVFPRLSHVPITEWDDYFYRIAQVVGRRSKDDCQVGAVIARGKDHILLSSGYNGPARDVLDLRSRLDHPKRKLPWMCHAETNAIYNAVRSGADLFGGSIYVTKFPCVMCASAIVQVGLSYLYTLDNDAWKHDPYDDGCGTISHTILTEAGIKLHTPNFVRKLERRARTPLPSFAKAA